MDRPINRYWEARELCLVGVFAAAAKLVSEDAPADWLFNYRITTATAKGVEGFPFDLNQTVLPLYNVTYTK